MGFPVPFIHDHYLSRFFYRADPVPVRLRYLKLQKPPRRPVILPHMHGNRKTGVRMSHKPVKAPEKLFFLSRIQNNEGSIKMPAFYFRQLMFVLLFAPNLILCCLTNPGPP